MKDCNKKRKKKMMLDSIPNWTFKKIYGKITNKKREERRNGEDEKEKDINSR